MLCLGIAFCCIFLMEGYVVFRALETVASHKADRDPDNQSTRT
jgi:hypothetical protein